MCDSDKFPLFTQTSEMPRFVVASAIVASAAAFSAPSAFMGNGLRTQVVVAAGRRETRSAFASHARSKHETHQRRVSGRKRYWVQGGCYTTRCVRGGALPPLFSARLPLVWLQCRVDGERLVHFWEPARYI